MRYKKKKKTKTHYMWLNCCRLNIQTLKARKVLCIQHPGRAGIWGPGKRDTRWVHFNEAGEMLGGPGPLGWSESPWSHHR